MIISTVLINNILCVLFVPIGAVTTQGPCFDKLPNCASYGEYVCQSKDFIGWVRTNCRKFCGICSEYI